MGQICGNSVYLQLTWEALVRNKTGEVSLQGNGRLVSCLPDFELYGEANVEHGNIFELGSHRIRLAFEKSHSG